MKRTSALGAMAVTGLLLHAAVGCSGNDEPPSDDGVARAQALIAPVEQALDHPTGMVDAESAKAVLFASEADAAVGAASDLLPASAPAAGPAGVGGSECIVAEGAWATMDLGCMTGGEMTGTIEFAAGSAADATYVYYEYRDVCVLEEQTCLDGEGASEVTGMNGDPSTMITAGSFDVDQQGRHYHVDYGYRVITSGQSVALEYVVFVDGQSFVMSAALDGETGSFAITGANGTFTCSYTLEGEHGECTSPDGSFSW